MIEGHNVDAVLHRGKVTFGHMNTNNAHLPNQIRTSSRVNILLIDFFWPHALDVGTNFILCKT
jgi:hypothetical protein